MSMTSTVGFFLLQDDEHTTKEASFPSDECWWIRVDGTALGDLVCITSDDDDLPLQSLLPVTNKYRPGDRTQNTISSANTRSISCFVSIDSTQHHARSHKQYRRPSTISLLFRRPFFRYLTHSPYPTF
jgi:hypothetical protein